MLRLKNKPARDAWLKTTLESLPPGLSLLDVGAGECAYKPYCSHLQYTAQDIAQYDGKGDGAGLQTRTWDFHQIDIVCDLYDIPENRTYDVLLCTEVMEHVVDPVRAIEKMVRLISPGGRMILTAPFNSLTHFAPYHYCTGFSQYFWRYHLERLGMTIQTMDPNGGFFDVMDQELGRVHRVRKTYSGWPLDPISWVLLLLARMNVRLLSSLDGPRRWRKSGVLQTFGWHILATKPGAPTDEPGRSRSLS